MTKTTLKILSILFAFFSLSAFNETIKILRTDNELIFKLLVLCLTFGFIYTSFYFWRRSNRTDL